MKTKGVILGILGVLLLSFVSVSAQQQPQTQPPQPPRPPMDPFGDVMFPPDIVMKHMGELSLTDDQKTFMRGELQKTTMRFNELQWQLQDDMEALHATLKADSVNQQLALSQLDKVLDAEREIKRMQFGLAISLKNKLTAEQQGKLRDIMNQMRGPGGGPGRGPGGPGGPRRGPDRGPEGPRPPRPDGLPRPDGPPGFEPTIP